MARLASTVCDMCEEDIAKEEPRYRLSLAAQGGRAPRFKIVAHVCEHCGNKTRRAWRKNARSKQPSTIS